MASAAAEVPTVVTDTEYAICAYRKLRDEDLPGATGVVRKVTKRDGTAFYVKRMVFQAEVEGEEKTLRNFLKTGVTESQVYNELDINEALSEALPDVVSRMIGSTIFREGDTRVAYLVFEGLEGMDALKYMRTSPSDEEISEIVACVREKLAKLHEAQYAHLDLQGPNIFVMTNAAGKFAGCRLIDFGGSRYVAEESRSHRDEFYRHDYVMLEKLEEQLKKVRDTPVKKASAEAPADITDTEFAICAYRKIRGANLAGATGVVRKVIKPTGTAFYVKKMKFRKDSREETLVWNELDINEALTVKMPDVVSRLIGSAVFREGDNRIAYMVFEGLVGVDGLDYMRRLPPDDEIARIVACVREKVVALHRAEYVHRDIQQPNIFVMTDDAGKFVDCRLIDFGGATYLGEFDGDAENEDEWEEWARKKRRLYARDIEMLNELEEKLKESRDLFAARARGGYRRTRRARGKKRGHTRRRR